MKRNNSTSFTLLALGILLTVIFVVFRVELFESVYYAEGFSDQMYELNLYVEFAAIMAATAWAGAAVYYYVFNSYWGSKTFKRTNHWYNWLATLLIVLVLTSVITLGLNDYVFSDNNLQYIAESYVFQLVVALYTLVLFVVASFSMRWWSDQAYNTPIPQ